MMNCVQITGRFVSDPELRHTPGGIAVTSFSLAVERDYATDGKHEVDFLDFVAWRSAAEFICKYFEKGQLIAVTGSVQTRTYTDKDKNKRKAVEIIINNAYFAGSKPEKDRAGKTPDMDVDSELEEMLNGL